MNRLRISILSLMLLAGGMFAGCKRNASVDTNVTPVAGAGDDQELEYDGDPVTVTLDGTDSNDPDGTVVEYIWMSDQPDAVEHPDNVARPDVTLEMGWYSFTLWVRDDRGHTSAPDSVVIAVGVPIDQGPPGGDGDGDGDDDGGADSFMPDEACLALSSRPDGACKDCECTPNAMGGCAEEVKNCLDNADATYQMLCAGVYDCSVVNSCSGAACFTPCMTEITDAANGDPAGMCMPTMPELSACSGASAISACRTENCMSVCM